MNYAVLNPFVRLVLGVVVLCAGGKSFGKDGITTTLISVDSMISASQLCFDYSSDLSHSQDKLVQSGWVIQTQLENPPLKESFNVYANSEKSATIRLKGATCSVDAVLGNPSDLTPVSVGLAKFLKTYSIQTPSKNSIMLTDYPNFITIIHGINSSRSMSIRVITMKMPGISR
jgi:hypothetical protein